MRKRRLGFPNCIALSGICVAVACLPAAAKVAISPAYVDVALDKGPASGRFQITNLSDQEERFRINILHFYFSREGGLIETQPDENSLSSWIKLNPREFTLGPQTKRVVRFMVLPKGQIAPGEYWGAIQLESLRRNSTTASDGDGTDVTVQVVSAIMVPVFGRVGEIRTSGSIRELGLTTTDGSPAVRALVANTGGGRLLLDGQYTVVDNQTGTVRFEGPIGRAMVFRDGERLFSRPLDGELPPGEHTLRVRFSSDDLGEDLTGEVPVTGEVTGGASP